MPRIRKKTSKRGTTHQREKIKRKAAESRRKVKKEGKKDVTWKTKHAKDPGIPNNFPYKDQILAEIAEERRRDAEAKQKKKEDKKAVKLAASATHDEEAEAEGSESGFNAIGTLKISASAQKLGKLTQTTVEAAREDDDDVPVLINRDLPNLKVVLDRADVILEVLDTRDPLPFRSQHLEKLAKKGNSSVGVDRVVMVLNKIDTAPRESVSSWAAHLREDHPTFLFRSASAFLPAGPGASASSKGKGKAPTDDGLGVDALLDYLAKMASGKTGDDPLVVAVVGLANVGKSALLNTLAKQAAFPIYRTPSPSAPSQGPTTTTYAQEITLSSGERKIRFIDTPGLSWKSSTDQVDSEERRIRDILLRCRGRVDKLKDPEPAVDYIVKHAEHEDLMLLYSLPAFLRGDTKGFLAGVARVNGLIKKGGVIDHATAARTVLRDWSTGKFARYTTPPSSSSSAVDAGQAALYAKDSEVLVNLKTRKEMRTGAGLVKITAGVMEDRMPALEENWVGEESEDDEEQEEAVGGEDDDEASDEKEELAEDENDEDENEDEAEPSDAEEESDEEVSLPAPAKRKRTEKAVAMKAPPPKKVTFASLPTESKQSRTSGSLQKTKRATKALPRSASLKKWK